ncbi:TatD family hydrolase [Pseudobacteroides cellulosolvens]|uniref:Hydrolase, TatD family n=1 Tax=Pseudobacteroides cellulosolvens ATCC 35603 = DSM 2933 TaxID=398512 RepID=A0A0L6JST0_9FIRM|nr:TatD family hydrolase [Pseudobacteroides cellulosolvens]KNY28744.1 hydrolase, TatD family [Pseudobacteroides cellulosolvens ATCC 35603 = DSM 2933]
MLFDSHAHYDDEKFQDDREEVLSKAHEDGVSYILNAATDIDTSLMSIEFAEKFDFIYASVGIHPHNASTMDDSTIEKITELASNPKVVAIGEIGLDYYYDYSPKDVQKYWFKRQLDLAAELSMPAIIHDRDAHEDIINIIKESQISQVGGVMHCFSGSVEMAKILLDMGFHLSFGGPVTFKNARKAIEVLQYVPMDRILIETDSPYLSPEPLRGKRNDSRNVRLVAEKIAEIKGIDFDVVASVTLNNARRLFDI